MSRYSGPIGEKRLKEVMQFSMALDFIKKDTNVIETVLSMPDPETEGGAILQQELYALAERLAPILSSFRNEVAFEQVHHED